MFQRIWDAVARRWWTSLMGSVVCFSLAALLLWLAPAQSWSLKLAVSLGIVGLCLAGVTVISLRGGDASDATAVEPHGPDAQA